MQVIPGNVEEYTILFTCIQFPHIFVRIFHLLTPVPRCSSENFRFDLAVRPRNEEAPKPGL